MTYQNRWAVVALAAFFLIFAQGWYANRQLANDNRQDAEQACLSQNATVEILRLFLADHEDIRSNMPPDQRHPETLREIDLLLDAAECNR